MIVFIIVHFKLLFKIYIYIFILFNIILLTTTNVSNLMFF